MCQDVFLECADGSIVPLHLGIVAPGGSRDVGGEFTAFSNPLVAAAIEEADILMTEQGEDPQCVSGPPVGLVAVNDHGAVAGNSLGGSQGGESRAIDVVAGDFVIQIGVPVDLDRAGDVAGFVEEDILIGLHNHQLAVGNGAIGQRCREPLGGYEAFGVRISCELFVLFNGVGHGGGLSLTTDGARPNVAPVAGPACSQH